MDIMEIKSKDTMDTMDTMEIKSKNIRDTVPANKSSFKLCDQIPSNMIFKIRMLTINILFKIELYISKKSRI